MASRQSWRGDEVAARPAVDAGVQGLEDIDDFAPPALDVVCGHERDGADAQGADAGRDDLDAAVIGGGRALEGEREFAVGRSQAADRQRTAVGVLGTAPEADRRPNPGIAREEDVADVGSVAQDGQSGLANAAWLGRAQRDLRGMITHEGVRGVHGDRLARADRSPATRRSAEGASAASPRVRIRIGSFDRDRVEELAIVDHLRPHPAVDERAGMFDEHAVEIRIDGREALARVDHRADRRGGGRGHRGRG